MGLFVMVAWAALWIVVAKGIADGVHPDCGDGECQSCPFPCERRNV